MDISKRILVVEDDERVLFVLHDILAGLGNQYEVVTAQSGYEALNKAREMPFDLLITDLRMTGMDGVEKASADHEMGFAEAVYRPRQVGAEELETEIEKLGYTVTGTKTEAVEG